MLFKGCSKWYAIINFSWEKKKIIKSLNEKGFFYTTFGGEALSLASALSTINYIKKHNVCEKIQRNGNFLQKKA